ncbi:hypothetical protein JNW88_06410 [Micromonospora sp. ATA32]|nr:hypothetical protein [Micromonospora sp. ATA32]
MAMTVYRSRNAVAGPLTPDRIAGCPLPLTRRGCRGYRVLYVDALLHRLAFELGERSRQLDEACAENRRIKHALRSWQAEHAASQRRS